MNNQIEQLNQEKAAVGRERDPQDAKRTTAESRYVKRDKRPEETSLSKQKFFFPDTPTENVTFTALGRRAEAIQLHPIPNDQVSQSLAHVDWLGFTVKPPDGQGTHWLFQELRQTLGLAITKINKKGWNGYTQSANLGKLGFVAWGGKAQRNTIHVEINGTGCSHIEDWEAVETWGKANNARITRIDLAHDDLDGTLCNIDHTLEWQEADGFNAGGRNAKVKLAGDWHTLTDGRTIYVGTRGNKMLRCYEKGKQLGDPDSPWFRIELEIHNKNRLLPWDMVTRCGQYLAGAYPCLAFLSAEQIKIKTQQKATSISLERVTDNAARLSGKAINVLMQVNHEDANAVVSLLRRDGIPKRLEPYESALQSYPCNGIDNEDI